MLGCVLDDPPVIRKKAGVFLNVKLNVLIFSILNEIKYIIKYSLHTILFVLFKLVVVVKASNKLNK